jgi:hypothetical protein
MARPLENCRCFGYDSAPGVAPRGAFWSRTVLPTVARWFVPDARETMDNLVQVDLLCGGLQESSPVWEILES